MALKDIHVRAYTGFFFFHLHTLVSTEALSFVPAWSRLISRQMSFWLFRLRSCCKANSSTDDRGKVSPNCCRLPGGHVRRRRIKKYRILQFDFPSVLRQTLIAFAGEFKSSDIQFQAMVVRGRINGSPPPPRRGQRSFAAAGAQLSYAAPSTLGFSQCRAVQPIHV